MNKDPREAALISLAANEYVLGHLPPDRLA